MATKGEAPILNVQREALAATGKENNYNQVRGGRPHTANFQPGSSKQTQNYMLFNHLLAGMPRSGQVSGGNSGTSSPNGKLVPPYHRYM